MMTLSDSIALARTRETLARGRCLSLEQAKLLLATEGNPNRDRQIERAIANTCAALSEGRKVSADHIQALRLLAPGINPGALRPASSAKSGAERQAAMVTRQNNIAPIPDPVDVQRRMAAEEDLVAWGTTYCAPLLKHAPSERMATIARRIQAAIESGGKVHLRIPRGKGKSTWLKIAVLWSVLSGRRRFVAIIAATGQAAETLVDDIKGMIASLSRELREDYPEVCYPIAALENSPQRAKRQHVNGEPTSIVIRAKRLQLPTVTGSPASGATIVASGLTAAIRGMTRLSDRPDLILLDDPQTRDSAESQTETDKRERLITGDIYGLESAGKPAAMLMSSTPIAPNDLSVRFADPKLHPEWITESHRLVESWPDRMDLWETFAAIYRQETIAGDISRTESTRFYGANRAAMDAGASLFDDLEHGSSELSALHHIMLQRLAMSPEVFAAEYQMTVQAASDLIRIDADTVATKLNGHPPYTIPLQCTAAIAYVDVNAAAKSGLRWTVTAVSTNNVAAVVDYGRYPSAGRLYPPDATQTDIADAISRGLQAIANHLAAMPLNRAGQPVKLYALAIDGGWQTAAVSAFVAAAAGRLPFQVIWTKGFGYRMYRPSNRYAQEGNHVHLSRSENGYFLAIHADYWREWTQRALLAQPLQRGSLSLFGSDPRRHTAYAEELSAERLTDRGTDSRGQEFWTWEASGPNHYGDTCSGSLAVAAWYRLLADPATLLADSTGIRRQTQQPVTITLRR